MRRSISLSSTHLWKRGPGRGGPFLEGVLREAQNEVTFGLCTLNSKIDESPEIRPLASLKKTARHRKPGYLQRCLQLGQLDPERQFVHFTPENWMKIRQEFKLGLGDAIHAIAGPVGRALRWPCMKGDGTIDLKPGSPCDRARNGLNRLSS